MDVGGRERPLVMGSYGIGLARTMAALYTIVFGTRAQADRVGALAQRAHLHVRGERDGIAYAAESARLLRNEIANRSAVFKKLKSTGLMPDGKVTRELAAKFPELRPLTAIFDEVQNLLTDKHHGEQAAEDAGDVVAEHDLIELELIETLRFTSGFGYTRLDLHLGRMERSAAALHFPIPR